jgi:hypothetical protein
MSVAAMALSETSIPRRSERLATRAVDGKAVVVVLDARKLHTLNKVGTRVFDLCDGSRAVAAIAAQIALEYGAEVSIAERDVLTFVARLIEEGAVELASAEGPR